MPGFKGTQTRDSPVPTSVALPLELQQLHFKYRRVDNFQSFWATATPGCLTTSLSRQQICFQQHQLATSQHQMDSIDLFKPLSTVLNSAINKSQQHFNKRKLSKRKILGNAKNRTPGHWVQSESAIHCAIPNRQMAGMFAYYFQPTPDAG